MHKPYTVPSASLTSESLHLSPALLLTLPVPLMDPCSPVCAPARPFAEPTQLLTRTAQSFLLSPPTAPRKPKAHHQTGSLPPSGPAGGTSIRCPQKISCEQPTHMYPLSLLSIYVTDGMCKVVMGIWTLVHTSSACYLGTGNCVTLPILVRTLGTLRYLVVIRAGQNILLS